MPQGTVDFVVNCYEKNYRLVLSPGYIAAQVADQRFSFSEVTVLVNNVLDREDALTFARNAPEPITRVEFVDAHLDRSLERVGLPRRRIRRLQHFTDCAIVAACLDGPEWMVYWDSDARLSHPIDWVSPSLEKLREDAGLAVANPDNWHPGLSRVEADFVSGDFAVGYGFSDVAFLVSRKLISQPIYRKVAPASWRYPLSSTEAIFEQRVDAWMRRTRRRRLTYLPATVEHADEAGANYPTRALRERIRGRAQSILGGWADAIDHPAMRAWPRPPQ